ncbi:MAG: CYTH domain-containing protein [Clostridiales bacterium]|jgi:inorganic triphosphatase YgiF|nr:CYTH domain-containing protein [Clostridiales bacterium]
MGKEIELKYAIIEPLSPETLFGLPEISRYISEKPVCTNMLSIYYDTSYGLLAKYGGSLRLRRENEASVVTFKSGRRVSGALSQKNEWQVNAPSLSSGIPLLIDAGAPRDILETILVSGACELARVEFTRYAAKLCVDESLIFELCHDTGFFIKSNKKKGFSEIELELIRGDVKKLMQFGALLEQTLIIKPEQKSKLARAISI